jgi:hypothetical protein
MSSKYSKEQLKEYAQNTLEAKEKGSISYPLLVSALAGIMGLTQEEVERKIQELADTGETT